MKNESHINYLQIAEPQTEGPTKRQKDFMEANKDKGIAWLIDNMPTRNAEAVALMKKLGLKFIVEFVDAPKKKGKK